MRLSPLSRPYFLSRPFDTRSNCDTDEILRFHSQAAQSGEGDGAAGDLSSLMDTLAEQKDAPPAKFVKV